MTDRYDLTAHIATASTPTSEGKPNKMSNITDRVAARLTNLVARRFPSIGRRATESHVEAYRSSGGRKRNTLVGRPVFLLDVVGRSSGASRPVMLMYVPRGDDLIVVGSAGGSATTPNWYKNLMAAGGGDVQVGGDRWSVTAREVAGGRNETSAGRSPRPPMPGSTRIRPSPIARSPSPSWSDTPPHHDPRRRNRSGC